MVSQEEFDFVTEAAMMGGSDLKLHRDTHNVKRLPANLLVHFVSSRLDGSLPK